MATSQPERLSANGFANETRRDRARRRETPATLIEMFAWPAARVERETPGAGTTCVVVLITSEGQLLGTPADDALRVAYCLPAHPLPAPIARIIALTAPTPTTLGLSGTPFYEPFHGRGAADSRGLDRCDRRSAGL